MPAANASARPPASPGGDAPHSSNRAMATVAACAHARPNGHPSAAGSGIVCAASAHAAATAPPGSTMVVAAPAAAVSRHHLAHACPPALQPCEYPRGRRREDGQRLRLARSHPQRSPPPP
eukprot:781919-Prymnesium_polylepis.1